MNPYYSDDAVMIYHGDCREILPELGESSIDLIFTDPPYPREFIGIYGDIASAAARLLVPGGSCFAYAGHFALPEVMRLMGEHLGFYWIAQCDQPGSMARMMAYRIACSWKPVLWYKRPPLFPPRTPGMVIDRLRSPRAKSNGHPWEQRVEGHQIIETLTEPDGLMLDPCLGVGASLVAAKAVRRKAIGIEIEERYCEIAAKRMAQEVLAL